MKQNEQVNYLTYDQALELVDRIAIRAQNFNYSMTENEKESMAQFLSDIGVNTSDLIDVSNLADNYAINAEIVGPEDAHYYDNLEDDSLFSWEENGEKYYCYQW